MVEVTSLRLTLLLEVVIRRWTLVPLLQNALILRVSIVIEV